MILKTKKFQTPRKINKIRFFFFFFKAPTKLMGEEIIFSFIIKIDLIINFFLNIVQLVK